MRGLLPAFWYVKAPVSDGGVLVVPKSQTVESNFKRDGVAARSGTAMNSANMVLMICKRIEITVSAQR
jgi:hypothetical protein